MEKPVNVPQFDSGWGKAVLLEWKCTVGSRVDLDEVIVDIETDKVVLEVPAPCAGWIAQIAARPGDALVSGQVIAYISDIPAQPPMLSSAEDSPSPLVISPPRHEAKTAEPTPPSRRIFLSYRREDSIDISDRMFDELVQAFGDATVFKDVDSLPLGYDFRQHLRRELDSCCLVLAVIGRSWLTLADAAGNRRLDLESDFVRLELEVALSRSVPVVPVLVGGAAMPLPTQLPPSLQELAFRHGTSVRSGPHFRSDMALLIRGLRHHIPGEA